MVDSNQPYQRVADPTWAGAGIGAGSGVALGAGLAGLTHYRSNKFKGMGKKGKAIAYLGSSLLGGGAGFFLGGVAGSYYADARKGEY